MDFINARLEYSRARISVYTAQQDAEHPKYGCFVETTGASCTRQSGHVSADVSDVIAGIMAIRKVKKDSVNGVEP
jgi:hypothetical protein